MKAKDRKRGREGSGGTRPARPPVGPGLAGQPRQHQHHADQPVEDRIARPGGMVFTLHAATLLETGELIPGDSVVIGEPGSEIVVSVGEIVRHSSKVKVSVSAPREIRVDRASVWLRNQAAREAAEEANEQAIKSSTRTNSP